MMVLKKNDNIDRYRCSGEHVVSCFDILFSFPSHSYDHTFTSYKPHCHSRLLADSVRCSMMVGRPATNLSLGRIGWNSLALPVS
jgi:hypothetical protein